MQVIIELNDLMELATLANKNGQQFTFNFKDQVDIERIESIISNIQDLPYKEKKFVLRNLVENNPSVKMKITHHGGCLKCTKPEKCGLGYCLSCQYCSGNNWSMPDLSSK